MNDKHMIRHQYRQLLGKCKWKPWWAIDTTTPLLASFKEKSLTVPSTCEDVKQIELSHVANGTENWHTPATLENCLAIPLLDVHPRKIKTYVPTKACTRMFIIALYNYQNGSYPGIRQRVNRRGTSIPWMLPSSAKEQIIDTHGNTDESQRHCAEWMKLVSKGYIPNDSICTIFLKKRKLRCQNPSGCQGCDEGRVDYRGAASGSYLGWWSCSES